MTAHSSAAVTAVTPRLLLIGFGLGCASMIVAARGGAASGSLAPIVIAGSMPAVMLAAVLGALAGKPLAAGGRALGWAAAGTLALFGAGLGWIARGVGSGSLPSWPIALALAVLVAVPSVVGSLRAGRRTDG